MIAVRGRGYNHGMYTDIYHVARKEYTCSVCQAKIRKGEPYIKRVFKGENGYSKLNICIKHGQAEKLVDTKGRTLWEK